MPSGGIFDYETKVEQLEEVSRELEDPDVWNNPEYAQELGKKRSQFEAVVNTIQTVERGVADATELLELAESEEDESTVESGLSRI